MPEDGEKRGIICSVRNLAGIDLMKLKTKLLGDPARDLGVTLQIITDELHTGSRVAWIERCGGDGCGCFMALGERRRHAALLNDGLEAAIEVVDPDQVVQDSLIYGEPCGGERPHVVQFDQSKAAQWTIRRQSAPMGIRKIRQRKAECRNPTANRSRIIAASRCRRARKTRCACTGHHVLASNEARGRELPLDARSFSARSSTRSRRPKTNVALVLR